MFYREVTKIENMMLPLDIGMKTGIDEFTLECVYFDNESHAAFTTTPASETEDGGMTFVNSKLEQISYVDGLSGYDVDWMEYRDSTFYIQQDVEVTRPEPVKVGDKFLNGALEITYFSTEQIWAFHHDRDIMMEAWSSDPRVFHSTAGDDFMEVVNDLSYKSE